LSVTEQRVAAHCIRRK